MANYLKDYVFIADYAREHGYKDRGIQIGKWCREGRIEGAIFAANRWLIPADTVIPDRRVKSGKYVGWRKKLKKTPYPNIKEDPKDDTQAPE